MERVEHPIRYVTRSHQHLRHRGAGPALCCDIDIVHGARKEGTLGRGLEAYGRSTKDTRHNAFASRRLDQPPRLRHGVGKGNAIRS